MQFVTNKIDFFKMVLKDRLAVASVEFPLRDGGGRIDFYSSPLGILLVTQIENEISPIEIKMYDRKGSSFACQNVFCGENLLALGDGKYVSVSARLQIEDIIDRDFLIKTDEKSIVARAQMLPRRQRCLDKKAELVYN